MAMFCGMAWSLVGIANGYHSPVLRPDFQIHLHRFLSWMQKDKQHGPTLGSLLASLAIAGMVILTINTVVHFGARKSLRRHLLHNLERVPASTDTVFIGNSLVEAGCDTRAFKTAWPDDTTSPAPLNLALGDTSPVEHYLIFNRVLSQPIQLKYVVYGFFDDQLNAPISGGFADLLGNRAFSYYFPVEAAEMYSPGSSLAKSKLWLIGHIPMLAERSSVWEAVELVRRKIEEIGLPKHKTNRYGRVDDFAIPEARDVPGFNQRCEKVLRDHKGFSRPVNEILHLARQHDAQVLFVEMPMPSQHRKIFYSSPVWLEMRRYLRELSNQSQAIYLQTSDWVGDDSFFEDAMHLNEEGAKLFSAKLAREVAALGK